MMDGKRIDSGCFERNGRFGTRSTCAENRSPLNQNETEFDKGADLFMTLACDHCGEAIEFRTVRPKFCGFCGKPVSEVSSRVTPDSRDSPTIAHTPTGRGAAVTTILPPPDRVGGYCLIRELGRGGMGTVYEAEESQSGRRVALKLLAPEITAAREALERFRQEGRLASSISHPRCVFVLNADEDEGRPFIVMELMPGSTLQDLVAEGGPLSVDQAVPKILDVMEGLREAHRLGLIHRDVKPSNCFIDAEGRIKVGDFGLSKSLVNDSNLTRTGSFLGTPLYASPEQIKGESLDARTDVYSVSATLYYLLAGRAPFQGTDAAATLAKIVSEPPPPIRSIRPEISVELERILLKGLERNRDRRYRDLGELSEALLPFAPGRLQIGGLGLRIAAFLLEVQVSKFLLITLITSIAAIVAQGKSTAWLWNNILIGIGLDALIYLVAYFVIEPILGASPGKWLLNLRVRGEGTSSPGARTILLRSSIFWAITGLPTHVIAAGLLLAGRELDWSYWSLLMLRFIGLFLLIVAYPMRAKNGYQGLHDRLTGTRVVSLPRLQKRRMANARRALGRDRGVIAKPVGVLRSIGPYKIRGAVRWEEGRKVLAAEDSTLGREVWIVLRPKSSPSPEPSRRELARATRPRWLSGGEHPEGRWDAYIAPSGCPLVDLAGPEGLSWRDARPILEDLVDELDAAIRDGTLPEGLTVDQVWIQPDGRAMIVDQLGLTEPIGNSSADRFRKARDFLGEAAAVMLMGGRRRKTERGDALRAAIPLHARNLLDRLHDGPSAIGTFAEIRAELDSTQDHPSELNRSLRAVQVGAMSALLLFGMFFVFGVTYLHLDGPNTTLRGEFIDLSGEFGPKTTYAVILGIPALFVAFATVFRGGLVLQFSGCGLVRRDGRLASRIRCLWRSLLVWFWPSALLAWAIVIQGNRAEALWTSWTLFTIALVYVMACPLIGLIRPERGVHDHLSGTVVVPR